MRVQSPSSLVAESARSAIDGRHPVLSLLLAYCLRLPRFNIPTCGKPFTTNGNRSISLAKGLASMTSIILWTGTLCLPFLAPPRCKAVDLREHNRSDKGPKKTCGSAHLPLSVTCSPSANTSLEDNLALLLFWRAATLW